MKRFITVCIKLLLQKMSTPGGRDPWARHLLFKMFDNDSDPTLYNDKWENPGGKHLPVIQKGEPEFFTVARDTYIRASGNEVVAGAIQRSIKELLTMQKTVEQHEQAAKGPGASKADKELVATRENFMRKKRREFLAHVMLDVKLLRTCTDKFRQSMQPPLPLDPTPMPLDSTDDRSSDSGGFDPEDTAIGAAADSGAAEPPPIKEVLAPVIVPGEDVLPKVAVLLGDYLRRDAPRLLHDLEAVMKLLYLLLGKSTCVRFSALNIDWALP